MENLINNIDDIKDILSENIEFILPKELWIQIILIGIFIVIPKIIFLSAGIFIAILLYSKCMFDETANSFVIIFFAIIGLACFQSFGLNISKVANIKFP